ncbi:hypothetical protein HK097_008433 [Rhizophlyctis rosea]|uniref:SCP domain-containing protein n=1 Tax=Rhizophlyctis rosea TaxID=64517 RepID=A0AAD5SBU0_9FUNG|nr:hypothetical protein HK097_008433 [Rhizophlyctis rosea]
MRSIPQVCIAVCVLLLLCLTVAERAEAKVVTVVVTVKKPVPTTTRKPTVKTVVVTIRKPAATTARPKPTVIVKLPVPAKTTTRKTTTKPKTTTRKTTTKAASAAPTSYGSTSSFPKVPTTSGINSPPPTAAERSDCLAAHNAVRKGIPSSTKPVALTYDTNLEKAACAWSKYLANTGKFEHSQGKVGNSGENLYMTYSYTPGSPNTSLGSCRPAVEAWASEKSLYAAGTTISNTNYHGFGHYTQIVWPDTTRVGCCGWWSKDGRQQVWTCEYDPAGNWLGRKAY